MSQRIAFIRKGPWPAANESVAQELAKQFPECKVDMINVADMLAADKKVLLYNSVQTMKWYGRDIVRKKRKFGDCFWRTPYIFNQIKRRVGARLQQYDYTFSFQMQSLFDASTKGLPHYVYTDHTHLANLWYPDFTKDQLYHGEWIAMEKSIYENATLIFTRSSHVSASLLEQYACPPDKLKCVYAGSNATQISTVEDAQTQANVCDLGQRSRSKNILFVGIDWKRKGGDDLVAAFRQVLRSHPDAHLTIVGCTPDIDLPNTTIVGRVPLSAVDAYYQNAAVFCLPTHLEPFGVVFVEALTHKLPIVATNIGAIPDFVESGENGYLVPPQDINALTIALIDLLDSPEKCVRFGDKGYQLAYQRYTWTNVGKAIRHHIQHPGSIAGRERSDTVPSSY